MFINQIEIINWSSKYQLFLQDPIPANPTIQNLAKHQNHNKWQRKYEIIKIDYQFLLILSSLASTIPSLYLHFDIYQKLSLLYLIIIILVWMDRGQENRKWWSSAKQWMQKQYFKVAHTIDLGINDENADDIWIFGHECQNNQTARIIYSSTLWFTYRDSLHFQNQQSLTSDVGWGCMLRVGQMMLAEALRRSEGVQNYGNEQLLLRMIDSFMDEKGPYSIQKMVKKGEELYKKGAGQWFTPSQTAFILKDLENNNRSSKLRVIIFHNEFESTSALQYLNSQNKDKTKTITPSQIKKVKDTIKYGDQISTHPGLIIILVRIGYQKPQPELLQSILTIMKLSAFAGILGGRPGKAHYIIGATANNFIYLDPHYVKQHNAAQQFFSLNMFSMSHEKVDTSMGLCFYVANYAEFAVLSDELRQLKNSAFFCYSIVQEPKLVQVNSVEKFQILQ